MSGGKYSIKPGDNLHHFKLYSGRNEIGDCSESRHSVSSGGEEVPGSIIQLPFGKTLRASQFPGESFPSSPECQEHVLMCLPVLHYEDINAAF